MQEQRIQRIRQKRNKLLQKKEKKLTKKVVQLKQFDIISNTKYILNVILLTNKLIISIKQLRQQQR